MLAEILWFVSWPVLIVISWYAVQWVIRRFESGNK